MLKGLEQQGQQQQKERKKIKTIRINKSSQEVIINLIKDCRNEQNEDKRDKMLHSINSMLLKSDQLSIPSHFTAEYVNTALHKIEGTLLLLGGRE
jgi:hypothetical protein